MEFKYEWLKKLVNPFRTDFHIIETSQLFYIENQVISFYANGTMT